MQVGGIKAQTGDASAAGSRGCGSEATLGIHGYSGIGVGARYHSSGFQGQRARVDDGIGIVLDVDGRHVEIDARPSDAIALAVRAKTPIYVEESVLERAGVVPEPSEESPRTTAEEDEEEDSATDENLDAYRDFINSLDVLDEFGKE